jgi:hypothetical protein
MTGRRFARWLGVSLLLTTLYGFASYPQLFVTPGVRSALLALNNGTTERFACLYGARVANTVTIVAVRPAPAAKQRGNAWATEVVCPDSPLLLGLAHNHPLGVNCWYRFPGTETPTSDLVALRSSGLTIGLIVCGETFVWELSR